MATKLEITPLTRRSFAPFGDVIETEKAHHFTINQGTTERFHDLARVDVAKVGGKPIVSIFESQPRAMPIKLEVMERHPLGSQAFFPLQDNDWLVVVANGKDPLDLNNLKAFRAGGRQGVNYTANTWHHPLLALHANSRFLVVDRKGPGENVEEQWFEDEIVLGD